MSVDVNNNFNSDEDKVQFALGTMKVYSVKVKNDYTYEQANYPGIIALNYAAALIKFIHHSPNYAKDHLFRVFLCE